MYFFELTNTLLNQIKYLPIDGATLILRNIKQFCMNDRFYPQSKMLCFLHVLPSIRLTIY